MFLKRIVESYLKYLCFLGNLLGFANIFNIFLQFLVFSSLIVEIAPIEVQILENFVEFLKENE
jgi:hypothetical protein